MDEFPAHPIQVGSVPVVVRDRQYRSYPCSSDPLGPLKDAPFVWLDSWEELPAFLEKLRSDRWVGKNLQARLMVWWTEFLQRTATGLAQRLPGGGLVVHRDRKGVSAKADAWLAQRHGQGNWGVIAVRGAHFSGPTGGGWEKKGFKVHGFHDPPSGKHVHLTQEGKY